MDEVGLKWISDPTEENPAHALIVFPDGPEKKDIKKILCNHALKVYPLE